MQADSDYDDVGGKDSKREFREMVAVNAYYRAEKRGFKPGHDQEDWFKAVLEIKNLYRYFK